MNIYAAVIPGSHSTNGSFVNWADAHMKAYCAWSGPRQQIEQLVNAGPPLRVLVSHAYDKRESPLSQTVADYAPLVTVDMMLDSGAFSAWTIGKDVDLDAYIAWAQSQRSLFRSCEILNLDVIPGAPARPPSPKERRAAIRQSEENADVIRAAGLPVMEVFHLYDEDFKVFERLWERRRPDEVLAIGGIAGAGTSSRQKQEFGDQVFSRVKEWCGGWQDIAPLHGLGVSPDSPLARRYPWYSVDSSSWNIFHRYGREIGKSGVAQKDSPDKSRTSVRAVSDLMYIRVVKRWRRLEAEYTALWERRGVTFKPREEAA